MKKATVTVAAVFIAIAAITTYAVNAYKFTECDFQADYQCEVIHGIGLIPYPTSIVTVWFDTDKQ